MHGSADVDIPLTPELEAACNAMPKGHLTYIVTAYGKPRSVAGLGNDFARWATDAKLPKRCRMHGLKKGDMRRLAEVGNTTHELMAISGHRTLSEVQRYTADADRKKLADSKKKAAGENQNTEVSNLPIPPRQTTG
jgi:integrase/recombinase XerD